VDIAQVIDVVYVDELFRYVVAPVRIDSAIIFVVFVFVVFVFVVFVVDIRQEMNAGKRDDAAVIVTL